jgi:hypothetical protein
VPVFLVGLGRWATDIEGWLFFDAPYMTVTTMTTVGSGAHLSRPPRVHDLPDPGGVSRCSTRPAIRYVVKGEVRCAMGGSVCRRASRS